ncbi:hypothetical protein GQX74_014659 [Glossina fuscipes]|nr:hypothetical protein GQX74_014659 [Glossina fuscipes]
MDTCFSNCKLSKSTDELFLFCCWCDGSAHSKCAGFKGKQFDYINFSTYGLRWTCPNCRDMDANVFKLAMIEDNFSKYKYLEQPELLPHNVRWSPASSIVSVELTTETLSIDYAGKASVEASIGTPVYAVPNLNLNNNLNSNNNLNNIPEVVINNPSLDGHRTPQDVPISISPLPRIPVAQSNVRIVDSSVTKEMDGLCNHDSVELVAIPTRKSIFVSRLSSDTTTGFPSVMSYENVESTDLSVIIFSVLVLSLAVS